MITWHLDPSVVIGLLLLTGAYVAGVIVPRRATPGQVASFLSAMLVLFLALESPLEPASIRRLNQFGSTGRKDDAKYESVRHHSPRSALAELAAAAIGPVRSSFSLWRN